MIKVSIVVPVYNVYNYIEKCLTSLAKQTIDDYEVIVVNDGSPDKSQDIIDQFVIKYPTIFKSFVKKNGGLSDARNAGMAVATGDYILYLDSDDFIQCIRSAVVNRCYIHNVDITNRVIQLKNRMGTVEIGVMYAYSAPTGT